jgi:predicted nucleic acid-binding protein
MTSGIDWFLLDASVWFGAKAPDSAHFESCRGLIGNLGCRVAALSLTMYEVANSLGARDGKVDEAIDVCRLITGRCGGAILASDPKLIRSALFIAHEHGLTAYDASYVAAARREDWTPVSLDIKDLVSKGLAITPDAAV